MRAKSPQAAGRRARRTLVLGTFGAAAAVLLARAVDLQVLDHAFLQHQGDARYLRVVTVPAHRGMITDRHGEPLAVSTPVDSVWANPGEVLAHPEAPARLARLLGLRVEALRSKLAARAEREFVYLKRHVTPAVSRAVEEAGLPGVALQREYHRYYPTGEVSAHVVGFTNIDDAGQEGLELAFEEWLRGRPGSKRVIKDRLGRSVEDVERIEEARPGRDLALSLDRRVQYLAYRELKAAVLKHRARAGSAVVLDVRTGEVLAMVNQPSFNPNNRDSLEGGRYRNRAVTDVFEPGSAIKPFTIAAALASGRYSAHTPVDTSPGLLRVGHDTVRDIRDYGRIDVATVIQKSSNVGAAKIALQLPAEQVWSVFRRLGIGSVPGSEFPGEAAGELPHFRRWHPIERATMAFGYGLSVTPLRLVQSYAALADGRLRPVTFRRRAEPEEGERVLSARVAGEVRSMLEGVVGPGGTGRRARVPGYRVAGKTGTVHKPAPGGYAQDRYTAIFAGLAPASRPRLAMVVVIDEPRSEQYYGGQVAAPVFARVMSGAMRLLDIAPDEPSGMRPRLAARAGGPT